MRSALNSTAWILLAAVAAAIAAAIFAYPKFESEPPEISGPDAQVLGAEGGTLAITIEDFGTGLRDARVALAHAGGEVALSNVDFGGSLLAGGVAELGRQTIEVEIDPRSLSLADGPATVIVSTRDWSWRAGGEGNRSEANFALTIDSEPPRISAAPGLTYVYRGGSAAAVYRVSETTARDGIRVADTFFRGHPVPGSRPDEHRRIAIFAVPVDAPANPRVEIEAEDEAGNAGSLALRARVFERQFAEDRLNLSSSFFDGVIPPLAKSVGVDAPDNVKAFQIINKEIRAANEARIRELIGEGSSERLWQGSFQQLPNSKVMSRFAERRFYYSEGKEISQATHLGFDLASRARAPITAANAGRVIFADDLGIYGNCVLVDHGLGLVSLYGHLSSIDVAKGDVVERGQVLGRSGATGLAGGDHLHFGVLVGSTYVDPIEWWDPRWIESHVEARLSSSAP